MCSKLQTELFRPIGPHQCSAETWERLTQNANIYAIPGASRFVGEKTHHAMPECSNYRGSELCQWPTTRHSQAVLNKLRLQRSKRGMHLPAQATVKPLHHPKALPWKHWYLACPEEQMGRS